MRELILVTLLIISMPSYAATAVHKKSKPLRILNEQIESVQIIEGTPKKKFEKLQPVWASASSMPMALKKLKKQAYKLGGNAIINFKTSTQQVEESAGAINDFFGYYGSSSTAQPVVEGWAVKLQ